MAGDMRERERKEIADREDNTQVKKTRNSTNKVKERRLKEKRKKER